MNRRIAKHYGVANASAWLPTTDDAAAAAGGAGAAAATATAADAGNQQVTLSQERITELATREKAEGRRAAVKEIAEKLGMSPDDAAAKLKEFQAAEDAKKDEATKREEALAAKEREIAAKEAAADAREREANRRMLLVGHGATGDDLVDAAALLNTRCPADADDAAVLEAAAKLKEQRPELFTGKTTTTTTPSTVPAKQGNSNTNGNGTTEFGADGAAEAARRFGKKETASV